MTTAAIDGQLRVPTPKGHEAEFLTRTDTNDGALVVGIVVDDEYKLRNLPPLEGLAIDIGAHIGSVAVALAIDHPGLRIIAVEPVPGNVEVLRRNIEANALQDRIEVREAAGAAPGRQRVRLLWDYRSASQEPEAYVRDSRYIANIYDAADSDADLHTVPAVSLDSLMADMAQLELLKIDCEGCEWQFLRSERVTDVRIIVGEYHNGGGIHALRKLIGGTHTVLQTGGPPDVGTFVAVRR